MMTRHVLLAALFTILPALIARADVKPIVEHNTGDQATPDFKFKTIPAPAGGALGKYRYLLFDISRTESDDDFGNTFYSEIDVIEQK